MKYKIGHKFDGLFNNLVVKNISTLQNGYSYYEMVWDGWYDFNINENELEKLLDSKPKYNVGDEFCGFLGTITIKNIKLTHSENYLEIVYEVEIKYNFDGYEESSKDTMNMYDIDAFLNPCWDKLYSIIKKNAVENPKRSYEYSKDNIVSKVVGFRYFMAKLSKMGLSFEDFIKFSNILNDFQKLYSNANFGIFENFISSYLSEMDMDNE